ncbi:hypothetical protein PF005_g5456 [Phytophthora fragariae]|uniref:Secreted protein n=2 Tax=Phytophthora TaxID=4783 RepID=A0A6A3FHZ1_9STRA|nr:hypothetical protein PF009_g4889 [Phytophthora fragariae]KAE9047995.1 hypothetical protein PR001_g3974 [Phytophthora rubi]KAE9127941.1 hypothetical protein PF007_g5431 [Phytophthora fragariae]KAE9225587.1 hypothetical protein PF005_g5456 [Phytophthora fragariae]KAE9248006.1 hypothetical protein PF002_g5990 [Phytophthora fragariae]
MCAREILGLASWASALCGPVGSEVWTCGGPFWFMVLRSTTSSSAQLEASTRRSR